MKIVVIGYSGAGKSTVTRELGHYYQIPVLHLDQVFFIENWQERNEQESLDMVNGFIEQDNWVIDGNFSHLNLKERVMKADKIIFMNYSRWVCFWRAFTRFLKNRGKTRIDAAPGCLEQFDFEFMKWILWESRSKEKIEVFKKIENCYTDKFINLKNDSMVKKYMERLGVEYQAK